MKNSLYDIFAEKWGSEIYVISDTHFSDLDCYRMRFPEEFSFEIKRGDSTMKIAKPESLWHADEIVKKLDKMQIDNINRKCGRASTLIILGDVGNIECVKKLKAKHKVLIMGNHDAGASNYKRGFETHHIIADEEFKRTNFKYGNLSKMGYVLKFEHYSGEDGVGEYWEKIEDNNLFDEVYEGPVQIGPKLILSHEPINCDYALNIHGHMHSGCINDIYHLNVIGEMTDYTPMNLFKIIKNGYLKDIKDIHRQTIDRATERKHLEE